MTEHVTISLDEEELDGARQRAATLGLSLEQYLETLIRTDAQLAMPEPAQVISSLFGIIPRGAGSATEVARDKDKMVGEAVARQHTRETDGSRSCSWTHLCGSLWPSRVIAITRGPRSC